MLQQHGIKCNCVAVPELFSLPVCTYSLGLGWCCETSLLSTVGSDELDVKHVLRERRALMFTVVTHCHCFRPQVPWTHRATCSWKQLLEQQLSCGDIFMLGHSNVYLNSVYDVQIEYNVDISRYFANVFISPYSCHSFLNPPPTHTH
eukprot:scpid54769/ scgid6873/ 